MMRSNQLFGVSGTLASMGAGVPYAIAAALVFPGRQVVAVVGDGGLSMSLGELATCRHYNLPIRIVVINNSSLGQIQWEQMMFLGHPEFGCALQPVDFARIAEGCGLKGLRITHPDDCAAIMDEAFGHDGPVLVDAVVVVHGYREHLLGVLLADHVVVQNLADVARARHTVPRAHQGRLVLFADDVHAQLDAFIADEDGRAGDQLADLVLALSAERAVEGVFRIAAAGLVHSLSVHTSAGRIRPCLACHVSLGEIIRTTALCRSAPARHPLWRQTNI